jgi:hypothetical protein
MEELREGELENGMPGDGCLRYCRHRGALYDADPEGECYTPQTQPALQVCADWAMHENTRRSDRIHLRP